MITEIRKINKRKFRFILTNEDTRDECVLYLPICSDESFRLAIEFAEKIFSTKEKSEDGVP